MTPPRGALQALVEGRHDDPFSLLGVFAGPEGSFARTWAPGAATVEATCTLTLRRFAAVGPTHRTECKSAPDYT